MLFGGEHLERALERLRGADPATVVRGLHAAAEEFSGGTLADDLCLVAARARGA